MEEPMAIPTHTSDPEKAARWYCVLCTALAAVSFGITLWVVHNNSGDHQVPQACLDAIVAAEDGFAYASDALAGAERGFAAAANLDPVALRSAAADIEAAGERLDQLYPRWERARTDCRAAAAGE